MDDFYDKFKQEEVAVREVINSISNANFTGEEKQLAIENSLTGISNLSNQIQDAAGRLPAHDLQTYSKAIDCLRKLLEDVRTTAAPKRKFAFKKTGGSTSSAQRGPSKSQPLVKRLSTTDKQIDELNEDPDKPISQQPSPPMSAPNSGFRLSSLNASHFVLPSSVYDGTSTASLEDISDSFVDITIPKSEQTSFATLMVRNVYQSLLICGNIAGSAHMTNVNNSTVVITARQIRLHDCKDVVLYLHCSSRPIIEDCTDVRFALLPSVFVNHHGKEQANLWNQVDDFKWLKAEPSPNWSVLKREDDRAIGDESWRDILDQKPSMVEVKQLLQSAKISH